LDINYPIFIYFGWILTTMARPKKDRKKVKNGLTIDPDLFEWVQSKIETKDFSTLSHAVNKALLLLKEKMEE
jgi:hypothetical protein